MTQCDRRANKRKAGLKGARVALACVLAVASRASAQRPLHSMAVLTLDVGSDTEDYLRWLQSLGDVPLTQWTIRAFGPAEVDALVSRPGAVLHADEHPVQTSGRLRWQVIPFSGDLWYNTGFPFGENDAAVWRGRGATVAASGGIMARYGRLSVHVQPLAFVAENRPFPIMTPRDTGVSPFADPLHPRELDRPQRFGDGRYGRVDFGQSTVRLDAGGLTASLSTANEWWGPMSEWPYLLGNNAAGFPHLSLGSAQPWNVGIGTVHGRVIYGRLDQSDYTRITGSASHQFITGIIASFRPRGVEGLEIGAARVFDISWPQDGISAKELRKPFEGLLKAHIAGDTGVAGAFDNGSADNQLASAFFRWVLPASGFELYGEFGRDDHSVDARDLALEPDHSMTLALGFRKAWKRADGGISGLGGELFDLDPSELGRHRPQGGTYAHAYGDGAKQGHTQRGQILGAGFAALTGAGTRIEYDRYAPGGDKISLTAARMIIREQPYGSVVPGGGSVDVQYALGAERVTHGRGVGLRYGLIWVYELNRYFRNNSASLQPSVGLTW